MDQTFTLWTMGNRVILQYSGFYALPECIDHKDGPTFCLIIYDNTHQ